MKKVYLLVAVGLLLVATACKKDKKSEEGTSETKVETKSENSTNDSKTSTSIGADAKLLIELEPKSNSEVSGNIRFTQEKGVVTMVAIIGGLSEGSHAIHLHEKSDCSSEDGSSTGGHWNPTAQPHGKWGAAEGYHKGDIGNFIADANGNGMVTHITTEWCIGCGDPKKDIIGKAVIVHQGVDDFKSQPSGAAGSRISCAAVIQ